MTELFNWPGYWATGWAVNPSVTWARTLVPVAMGLLIAAGVLLS